MSKLSRKNSTSGFTIIELMIATVIFSLIMLMCLVGMVQVSRAYYKGITHSRTQEASRLLFEEISQTIQLSGSTVSYRSPVNQGPAVSVNNFGDGIGVFCAGNKKYTYVIDRQVVSTPPNEARKETKNAIISEDTKCTDVLTPSNLNSELSGSQRSLLGEDMRLTKFSVTPLPVDPAVPLTNVNQLWKVDISVAFGDQDLLRTDNPANPYDGNYVDDFGVARVTCRSGTGAEFCSIVELSTTVGRRIGN